MKNVLDEANPGHAEVLNQIKKRFREETFTRQRISEAILAYPELVGVSSLQSLLVLNFWFIDSHALCELRNGPLPQRPECFSAHVSFISLVGSALSDAAYRPTLSYQRLKTEQPLSNADLHEKIRKTVANKNDLQIFESLLLFNQSVSLTAL